MSAWLNMKRIARYGLISFIRNGFISLSAVAIMSITLLATAVLVIVGAGMHSVLNDLTNKVDVSVYFATAATDDQIASVSDSLKALPQVAQVTLISRADALARFQERHKNDQLTMQALQELGDNPLGASIEVHAKDPTQYEAIAKYLDAQQASGQGAGAVIDRINFFQNKTAIDRLAAIIDTSSKIGLAIAIVLGAASIMIAFNTIRLAIYTARDEIGVMNIVGAGHWYVQGPFMIAGVLYGIVSGIFVLLILYGASIWLGPASQRFLGSFNVYDYFISAFPMLLLIVMGGGVVLGSLSSFLAVRRYLHT
jgi:cell division transport system permease protein